MGQAALAGRRAPDHPGPVGDGLFGMEGPVLAGKALAKDLGAAIDQDGHSAFSAKR